MSGRFSVNNSYRNDGSKTVCGVSALGPTVMDWYSTEGQCLCGIYGTGQRK